MARPDPDEKKATRRAAAMVWSLEECSIVGPFPRRGREVGMIGRVLLVLAVGAGLPADRPLGRRRSPVRGAPPRRQGRASHPDPPGVLRPDRPAPGTGADRGLRGGRSARRLRAADRRAAGLSPVRGALGPLLARS